MANLVPSVATVADRFSNALNALTLQRKVDEVEALLSECSVKELQVYYPTLVQCIFGVKLHPQGWGLMKIIRNFSRDYDTMLKFLHPLGPLFDVMYKLLGDVYLKYEFPLHLLPQEFQDMIYSKNTPAFYCDKIQINQHTRTPTALLLNAFEFYLFHFAGYLVNPVHLQVSSVNVGPVGRVEDNVYLGLCHLYFTHFLPVVYSTVLPLVPLPQTTPIPRSPPPQVNPAKQSKLLKPSVVGKLGQATMSPPSVLHPHSDVWRSETLIQVAICMWFTTGDSRQHVLSSFQSQSLPQYPSTQPYYLPYSQIYAGAPPLDKLPTDDHMYIIRLLVKHLYYFTNNILSDNTCMDELRRVVLTTCQRSLYLFLRRNIHHWPLDSSFKTILETYLLYIQPWRYQRFESTKPGESQRGESHPVTRRWQSFISENLLAYTVIMGELLPRFSRLDLTSPSHAFMLYRVSKVLANRELPALLKEIEACLDLEDLKNHFQSPSSMSLPFSHRLNALVRQQILELEVPNFQYKKLFSETFRSQIVEFLASIEQALMLVNGHLQNALAEQALKSSYVQMFKDFMLNTSSMEEYTISDREKTIVYLKESMNLLSEVFEVSPPEMPNLTLLDNTFANASTSTNSSFGVDETRSGVGCVRPSLLNPTDWKKRSKLIKYEGNPDLKPIQSTEVTFLVRFFHQLSSRINEMYGADLSAFWSRSDLWGRIARQLLTPPTHAFYYDKRVPGNFAPRVSVQLPPRVCLRSLASNRTISVLLFSAVFAVFCNYPLVPFYLFWLFVFVCNILVKALLEPLLSKSTRPMREPFVPLDVSFNE